MRYLPPQPVALTTEEQALWEFILTENARGHPHPDWMPVADAMQSLMESLLGRNAIPEIRIRLFKEPGLAEKGSRSRLEVFEGNGTRGKAIFGHGNFPSYLKHFIDGPDLPAAAIHGLCRILNEDAGTSGMVMDQWRSHAKKCVREFHLERHKAATEFFRLGVEIGMEVDDARTLRDAALSARSSR